ncbi:MAG: T9SS type A sorting domain-containing protein [Bacteroidaceae bacterium]|nr:T9SS type A sorting domain-containing protein [Bacteroidaceae bacterium]
MRKVLFLLFAVLLSSAAMADGGPKVYEKVVLTLTDGRVFDIDSESFVYSYTQSGEDGALIQYVEVSGKSEMYLFERSELLSIKFIEAGNTGIDDVAGVDESNPMRYINGELVFHSSLSGGTLYLYDAAGKQLMTRVVNAGKNISLANLAKGTYLAQVNDCKIKVVVR